MIIHPIKADFYIQHRRQEAGSSSSFILFLCQTGLSTLYQDKSEDLKQTKKNPENYNSFVTYSWFHRSSGVSGKPIDRVFFNKTKTFS